MTHSHHSGPFSRMQMSFASLLNKTSIAPPLTDIGLSNLFETLGLRETFIEGHNFLLDPLESYINCLQNFFNFELLRLWVMRFPKRMVIGVAGGQMEMYAKMIFGELLGM